MDACLIFRQRPYDAPFGTTTEDVLCPTDCVLESAEQLLWTADHTLWTVAHVAETMQPILKKYVVTCERLSTTLPNRCLSPLTTLTVCYDVYIIVWLHIISIEPCGVPKRVKY